MKEKNQYYSKNVEFIATPYKPEGQITKQDYDLLISSQKRDFTSLTQLVNTAEFKSPILNCALANLIQTYKRNDSLVQCIKLLLSKNINLTYKFTQKSNKTLLMLVIEKEDFFLLQIFLESINSRINSIKIIPNDKLEEYQISEVKKIFSQKDSYGNNFSHLFKALDKVELFKMFDFLYYKFPFLENKPNEISKGIQKVFQNLFLEKNDEGNTIMSLSLERHLIQIVFKLLIINGYNPNVNSKNNNLIHCAIKGKNLTCVKIILYYCSKEDLNSKNSDLLTPAQLANKLGLSIISNIINEYQNNFEEEEYKEHFYKNIDIYKNKMCNLRDDLLSNLNEMKYKQIFFELKELKIIYELSNDNFNINQANKNNNNNSNNNNIMTEDIVFYKISLFKIEWNIIICEIKLFPNNNNNKEKDKENSLYYLYKLIYEFYYNNFTNEFILSYINYMNQINKDNKEQNNEDNNENIIPTYKNNNKPIEIMIYNKIIFYFKIGDLKSLLETAQIYFTKKFLNDFKLNEDNYSNKNLFILLVNISCILIEILISQGYNNFAQLIITKLEKYIFNILNKQQNSNFDFTDYFKGDISIFYYLTKNGVFNQYSGFFSELFCYINFLKILSSKEENKNKEYFTKNKRLLDDSKFAQYLTIFNKLNCLYNYVVIKKMYENKEKEIYDKLTELNYSEENTIYYFNTLGLIFLRKQKFNMSKFFFAKGYYLYMNEIKNRREKQDKLFNFRIDIITALLYNISLCYFHLKQYQKCITILECILNFKINRKNFFIHYRLGLCYYYLYIESFNKNADYFNKNVIKLIGYEKIKNFKKSENVKQLSIELDDEGIISNLSQKFEAEHKKKKSKEKHENKFSFHNNDKNEKSDKVIHKYNNIYKSGKILSGINSYSNNPAIKRIILKNSTKLINKNHNNFFFNNKKNTNNNDSNKLDFLNKAIKCFKKVILISKLNGLDTYPESMKSLYDFYSTFNKDEDDTVKDNTEKLDNFIKEKEVPIELLINSYFNLLMCLSMKKNWLEMILIIKDYDNRDITSNKIIKLKIWLYELEAYTNLKNNKKINEILSKIKKFKKIELSVLNKTNNDIINDVNIKLYIYYVLTKIYIEEKNFKEADVNIKKIIFLVKDGKNIPYYIIDLLLNVYIIKLNSEPNINDKTKYRYNNIILNLIKNQKINEE